MVQTREQARVYRAQLEALMSYAPAEIAVKTPTAYPVWEAGKAYSDGKGSQPQSKVRGKTDPDRLYKCQQAHTSQTDWEPSLTPALWAVIDEAHAGTLDDPIPAARGMEYHKGRYYLDPEDGKTYLCSRDNGSGGGVVLHYLPHELIGHYFETTEPAA